MSPKRVIQALDIFNKNKTGFGDLNLTWEMHAQQKFSVMNANKAISPYDMDPGSKSSSNATLEKYSFYFISTTTLNMIQQKS